MPRTSTKSDTYAAPMTPLSLRIAEPQIKRLTAIRKKTGIPVNEIIRRFIDEGLRRMEKANAA